VWGEPARAPWKFCRPIRLRETLGSQTAWAIVPFDELNPRLKVLSIDGQTPFQRNLDTNAYPWRLRLAIAGQSRSEQLQAAVGQPLTNRDESKIDAGRDDGRDGHVARLRRQHGCEWRALSGKKHPGLL